MCVFSLQRIMKLNNKNESQAVLRLAVDGGGCSGFQYTFELLVCNLKYWCYINK